MKLRSDLINVEIQEAVFTDSLFLLVSGAKGHVYALMNRSKNTHNKKEIASYETTS